MLEGALALTAGDRELQAPAGSWVHAAPTALSFPEPVRDLAVRA